MSNPAPRSYPCCLCKRRTNPSERFRIKEEHVRILERRFATSNIREDDVLCSKCRLKCYREESKKNPRVNANEMFEPLSKLLKTDDPPSITLDLPSTSRSHAYCFICKRPGPKLIVAALKIRLGVFIRRGIFIPTGVRCCPVHVQDDQFTEEAMQKITPFSETADISGASLTNLLESCRQLVLERSKQRLDFDNPQSLQDIDYMVLTGISKTEFDDLMTYLENSELRSSQSRSVRTCVAILLTKLRCGFSNELLSTLFAMKKCQVRRAIKSATKALKEYFVPNYLGFSHITRDAVIEHHTRPLAKELFSRNVTDNPAILVLDGTYIYVQKSGNFSFSRRSFSLHKHRPLVKPMLVVSTTGYIISCLGPYLADSKNSDAKILNHMIRTNSEEIKEWLQEQDILVVDRGFRDSGKVLQDLGLQMEMPSFLERGQKQLSTEDANCSRLVTKIRWVVESANGRIKTWRLLDKTLPNTLIPYIGDFMKIICALCNKYRPPLSSGSYDEDIQVAAKMKVLAREANELQSFVSENELDKRSYKWTPMDAVNACPSFPRLTEEEIRQLTLGVYQVKLARSYTDEHCSSAGLYEILVSSELPNLLCAKIQSRHISSKQYTLWIRFNEVLVQAWYCKCKNGSRVVGMCAHVTSVVWFLAFLRHEDVPRTGVQNWENSVCDASQEIINDSDSDVTEE